MGFWDGNTWRWAFSKRRDFLQWEFDLFEQFLSLLQQHGLKHGEDDQIAWRYHSSGVFSTKAFCRKVESTVASNTIGAPSTRLAWKGLAPPRAKILVWFVLQGQLNTRKKLARFNIIPSVATVCPLCCEVVETVEHILCECMLSWNIWSDCMRWWGFSWCCSNDPLAFFHAWCSLPFSGCERKMWITLFYVTVWTLRSIRNKMVFEDYKPDWELEKKTG